MTASFPGVEPAVLRAGYRRCSELTWRHGTTYFWGAALLPRAQRRHVYAVYALCRLADDIVDAPAATAGAGRVEATRVALATFRSRFNEAVAGEALPEPVLAAVAQTVRDQRIPLDCFDRFFDAMAMDLDTTTYETWDDLLGYMEGSAAVIGEMMLPVLEPRSTAAREPARALGFAFQLTNFLRDVAEDLDRGRVYLPQEDLRRFGADPARRRVDEAWRALMHFERERNRALYRQADEGLAYLPPASRRCVATARRLYSQILDLIESNDDDVFSGRLRLPTWRKAATALGAMAWTPRSAPVPGAAETGREEP
ncbi:phytoene/squalene synthase family protein [Nigerium massiliense]|uniref:phytoene/squalene synthase family protein n=1 Tax=Nigerium massiliense TaxID=1522317 RepID=UPI00058AF51B|nr:phytoene/squalene synthase family protein [Nigerium massiliense]